MKNLSFRNIDAVSSRGNIIVFPFKKGMFENISFKDSTFTLLPNSTHPKVKHWISEDFGVFNLLGVTENIFTNCKGISADGKPFIVKKER